MRTLVLAILAVACGQAPAPAPVAEPPARAGSAAPREVRVTILYDNSTTHPALKFEHGFAALVEYGGHKLLFDTGADGDDLLANMRQLGIAPRSIEAVVLSHEHGDHTGGLEAVLAQGGRPTVYVPSDFSSFFKQRIRLAGRLVEHDNPVLVFDGVHVTRPIGEITEQALVLETAHGIAVVTGCAHPGVVTLVEQARELVPGKVELLVGGFHLIGQSKATLQTIVARLRELEVETVVPAHCSGDAAFAAFQREYGERCLAPGVGRVVVR